ncbi:MAG: thiamine-phosphate kinase [Elusimicrobia bacterium GWA2_56_46]|nr:MAG: thiamine-phosphate kinase [Elusimicrobia bacterium GWA2_56_46]OGR54348.1 MAG: thiamine-phosphate kinase [Elusimicrobia bacterium GWC2_56_31]HBB65720.1 thiamine-phosphate kinase [Elusimicrobiota bacterium]HBW22801.1 thiamine-phosphate kinase [Elusimicrobiota bacterium]
MKLPRKGEAGLLTYIEKQLRFPGDRRLILGPGDDCAVLKTAPGKALVITTDELVEHTHFLRRFSTPEALARKLLRVNLSDLAAMGRVRPVSCVVGSGLPKDLPAGFAGRFLRALKKEAVKFGLTVAGGNLSGAREMHFYMTVWGEADQKEIVTRYGARPGDILFSLGPLGEAKAGLEILKNGQVPEKRRFRRLVRAFLEPAPLLKEGALIGARGLASAMLDNSDGLLRSARILSELSRCRVLLEAGPEAVSPALAAYAKAKGRPWREYVFSGGEDYGLLFTVRPAKAGLVKKLLPAAKAVGRIEKGSGAVMRGYEGKAQSFSHF